MKKRRRCLAEGSRFAGYGKLPSDPFNFIQKRRCRLAVWRQLPKLIPAGSTPVTCSINRQVSTRGLSILLIYTKYLYCAKSWQWSIEKQKIYAIIRSRLQAKSIKPWGIMGLLNEIAERLWSLLPKGEIKMATPFSGFAN